MFIDELKIHLKAGCGGDGVVRWRHLKGLDHAGPSGGNGGRGGNVYALTIRDIGILAAYRNIKELEAGRGEDGQKNVKQGGQGRDLEIRLPLGSRLTNLANGYSLELLDEGEKTLLLHGGRGGLGNEHFKSSINTRPKEATLGESGEEAEFLIELLLAADVGFIGLPNAGKSSLLNALTSAHSKVGSYPFTTLEPALGSFYGLILADIPGLIMGASLGKGLGHKFLKHVERTRFLTHCVSAENDNPFEAYRVVRKELGLYNEKMKEKPEIIALTKVDMVSEARRAEQIRLLETTGREVVPVSVLDDSLVKIFGDLLSRKFNIPNR